MNDIDGRICKVGVLERCAGMNPVRAKRLLALLPELGRVSTPYAVRLAGLAPACIKKERDFTKKKALWIQRLLLEGMCEIWRDKESRLSRILHGLAELHPWERTRICLAATLRYYSDSLRHPGLILNGSRTAPPAPVATAYPETEDGDLLAAEDDSEP